MATPLPTDGDMDRFVPHGEETALIVRGLASAPRPTNGPTGLQAALFRAIVDAKSGLDVDVHTHEPVEPDVFGGALARRDRMLRRWLVHHMEPLDLVLQPLDQTAARRVETFAEEPCVGDGCVHRLRALAEGSLQLAAHGFDRNRYLNRLEIDGRLDGLRPPSSDPTPPTGRGQRRSSATTSPPAAVPSASCHSTRSVATSMTSTSCSSSRFRDAGLRATPAREHDWVHVLADYGTVEAGIEVFGFTAHATNAPDVVGLHVDELRRDLGVPPTSPETTAVGSVRPRHPDGMSHAQRAAAKSGRFQPAPWSPTRWAPTS